jgi:tetratricopeptide (TPR) repeat protein
MTLRTLERVFRAAKVEDPHEWNGLAELLAPMPGRGDVRFSRREERYAVIHRALLVLGRTTDSAIIRPILLWVDDAQVSPEALGFLNWLLRAGAPGPILALLTVQDEALRARRLENALLTPLLARPDVSTVDVPPLGPADARALAEALLGLTSGLVEQVVDRTAGNPLFAVQLVGDWVQRGVLVPSPRGFTLARGEHATVPDDIHALWRTRIDQAVVDHPFDREALEIAAALGLEVRADEWAAVGVAAGVAPGPDLVERLRDAGLVSIEVDGWSFVHGMLRESLARSAREAGRWAAWHRLCARVLTERGAGSVGVAERLGRHLLEAGDTQAAIGPLLAGAAERRASSAYEEALALLDARDAAASETLTAADRVEGLVLRADVLVAMGRLEDAEAVALRAAADAEALVPPRPSLTGRAWRHAATAAGRRGRLADQADRARRGEAATAESDTLEWARCVLVRGSAARSFGAVEDAVSLHREALSRFAEAGDVRGQADALAGLGAASFALGQLAPAEAHVRKALALFERVGGRFGAASCQNALGEILRARGDLEAAELSYRRAETWMRALGSGEWLVPRVNRAQIWMAANKTTMAEQGLAEALTEVKKAGRKPLEAVVEALLVAVAAQAGDWAAFDKHLGRAMALLAETRVAEADAARALVGAGDAAMAAGQRGRAVRAWALGRDQWGLMGRVEDREAAAARLVPRTK